MSLAPDSGRTVQRVGPLPQDPIRLALQGGVFRCWEGDGEHWAQDYAHLEPQAACLEAPGPGGRAMMGLATDYVIR